MKLARVLIILAIAAALSCSSSSDRIETINWWQFWTSPEVAPTINSLVSDFEAEHPDRKVELGELTWSDGHEKIVIAMAAGRGPDVVELGSDWIAEFSATDKLLDLTYRVDDLRDQLMMWEPAIYNDKVYGVPWMLGTRVLFANRELLSRAGYADDFEPLDWQQLLTAAAAVNDLGEDIHGFGSNSAERHRLYKKYLPFFWSAGGEVFNADRTATQFDSDAGRASLEYYLKLSDVGVIESQARLDEYFAAGKIGFVISGDWLVRKLVRSYPELDFFVQVLPGPSASQPGLSFAGGEYLVVSATTQSADAAVDLIRFLVEPENDQKFCRAAGSFTPANRGAVGTADSALAEIGAVFQQQLQHARSTPVHPSWVYIEEAIEKGVEQALYGKMTYTEALARIDEQCAEILKPQE